MIEPGKRATRQILQAFAVIGSSSVVTIVTGIVKAKTIAILLGPAGTGALGLLQSAIMTGATVVGMGLSNSGVREIADADAQGDTQRLVAIRTAVAVASLVLSSVGAVILLLMRMPIARTLLGDSSQSGTVVWMAVGVVATTLTTIYTVWLNGLRHLGRLARANILGGLVSMILTVAGVYWYPGVGVKLAAVSGPLATLAFTWWLSRQVTIEGYVATWRHTVPPLSRMLKLGFAFMASTFLTVGSQLIVRLLLTRTLGPEATGHFTAAWTISMLYLGFILGAMGTDYYPKLTALARDRDAMTTMVNEYAYITLLLSAPLVLGMLTFAPQVVRILYSGAFGQTVTILRWQLMGDLFKLASWAMSFILLAQARSVSFFVCELIWNLAYIGFVIVGLRLGHVEATGIAFLAAYILYMVVTYVAVYRLSGYKPNRQCISLFVTTVVAANVVFWGRHLPGATPLVLGSAITLSVTIYAGVRLVRLLGGGAAMWLTRR